MTDAVEQESAPRRGRESENDENSRADAGHSRADAGGSSRQGKESEIPIWEWMVAALGLLLVLASMGFMLHRALLGDESAPEFSFHIDSVSPRRDGFLLFFGAENNGGTIASSVLVEGELDVGSGAPERSTVTLDFVSSHSLRSGGLFFRSDPRRFPVRLRAVSYANP